MAKKDERRNFRFGTNQQFKLSLRQELDVAQKSVYEIVSTSELHPEVNTERKRLPRKTTPVFHHDLKTREISMEQYLLLPHVPPYNAPDKSAQVTMQSRTRKYPYVKGQLVTAEEMKKPKKTSVGVFPVRSSTEISELKVVLEGKVKAKHGDVDEANIRKTSMAQEKPDAPHLQLPEESVLTGKAEETVSEKEEHVDGNKKHSTKPAILSAVGTISSVTLTQRAKPQTKPPVIHSGLKFRMKKQHSDMHTSTSGAKSARSIQSSLLSEELVLPDEAVYSRYDDDIANIDADVDTAVGAGDGFESTTLPGIKSVKELLEEAKKITCPEAEPLYRRHLKPSDAISGRRKQDRNKSPSKVTIVKSPAQAAEGGDGDKLPAERSVDEIVATLKKQAGSGEMSEADRKIQEIMDRVMSRTGSALPSDADNVAYLSTPEIQNVTVAESGDGTSTAAHVTSEHMVVFPEGKSSSPTEQVDEIMRDIKIPDLIVEVEEPVDVEVGSETTGRTGETVLATEESIDNEKNKLHPATVSPINLDFTGIMEIEGDAGFDIQGHLDIQQAWHDLMAEPEATYEDLVSILGKSVDLLARQTPGPSFADPKPVHSAAVSFLSTWAPTAVKTKEVKEKKEEHLRSIHHFCTMTNEFQLPKEFCHVGRKYHTPDRFSGVFPQQEYRFAPGILQELEEAVASEMTSTPAESEQARSLAARRIIREANSAVSEAAFEAWKQRADAVFQFQEPDVQIEGVQIVPKMDESRVYWAPAPPKMEVTPAKVQQVLFPEYQSDKVDEKGHLVVTSPNEAESEGDEDEEETVFDILDREMNQRIVSHRHQSCEDLTVLMRAEILREKMILEKRLDGETYRPLITPPPSEPVEDPVDPKAVKQSARGALLHFPSCEKMPEPPPSPAKEDSDPASKRILGLPDDSLFAPVYFPPPRRTRSMPRLLDDLDDTLVVPLDFNTAMEELREQRLLIEREKHLRQQQTVSELGGGDAEPTKEERAEEPAVPADILHVPQTPKKEEGLTPAEKALLAGRNYVILPRKRKKKHPKRPLDMEHLEKIERFLAAPPNRLKKSESLSQLNHMAAAKFPVTQSKKKKKLLKHRSLPDLLNFNAYKTSKSMPKGTEEREWVRKIWNKWFDEVFPPTPAGSDEEDAEENMSHPQNNMMNTDEDTQKKEEKKKGKEMLPDILSEEIDEIDPIVDSEENAEVIAILREEIEKLTKLIDSTTPPMAFDLARRGALYRKLGMLKKAGEDLNRAIKMEPLLLNAYWHRHLLYVLQDKKAAALEDLNYIMKKNKHHAGAYRSMADIYRKQGDITMAIVNYTQAIKLNPQDHDAFFQRAEMYEQRGEMLLALEDYSKCMKLMPTRTDAIIKHGLYYFNNENWTNAINDFTELLRVDPLSATARLYRGRACAKLGQWSPAVEDLSAAIHLDPSLWDAFYHRACILRKAHPRRALHDYSVSLLINDSEENIMSYLHRGILYNSLDRPEDAIPDFEAVLKLDKDVACAHVNLGLIFLNRHQNHHRAIKKFTSAIKVDPTYIRAYICRAEAYHKVHELKLALNDVTRAIHLRPDVHHYYMYRGQLVLEMGNLDLAAFCIRHASDMDAGGTGSAFGERPTQQAAVQSFLKNYDKAIDALTQATRSKPVTSLFMLLGRTQMKAKQFKEAAASFQKALDLMRPWRSRDPWPADAAEAHFLSGMCHMELRSYLPAFNSFNSAISTDPNYAEAYYQRGLARMKLKQSRGIQDFNRALAINPNIFQAYLSRACYYGLKGVYTKAILNCNEAIKLQPNSVRAYLYRGALKYHIKAFGLAVRDLTRAAAIDSTCSLAYFNRAVCYQASKQHDKALTDYGVVLLLGDQLSLKVLINRGLLYFDLGDYMNALLDFRAACRLSPTDHRLHHTLGLCCHKLGRLQDAVSTYTQCLKLRPFFLDGLIARGNVYMDYGHQAGTRQARRDYERALHLDPMCLAARVNLAYSLQVTGKLMQAWRNFTIAITVRPTCKPALEGRSVVNLQMSDTFAAFQDITACIHISASAELLTNRGVISQFMGDRVNAMKDYQRAVQLDPAYSLAYFNAANVYFHSRHFKQALAYYDKAIQHNSKDESAFLNRAITKVLLRDAQSALEDFKRAAQLSPHSAHIYFNRANLFQAMQLHEQAEQDYCKALSLQPDDPVTLRRRADVRGKLGRHAEAVEDYRRAIDIQTRPVRVVPAGQTQVVSHEVQVDAET